MNIQLKEITDDEVHIALKRAVEQVKRNLPEFTYSCRSHTSVNGFYPKCENNQWTCGFWPGEIWLAYEYTGCSEFRESGLILVDSFYNRIKKRIKTDHHDMGFLYTPSCVAPAKLLNNNDARNAALMAADQLTERFHTKGNFIQAWGELGAPDNYRYIIDCLLNLPLLYWASTETGNEKYADMARKHTATCLKYSIREDGSTYHTVFMNPETGEMSHGATCQGYSDDSFWARGQAWAIYGTALGYKYEKRPEYLDAFKRVLRFYTEKLPADLIPYWDMIFTSGNEEPRDSSSASIVACGLLEVSRHVDEEEGNYYKSFARQMIKSLVDNYSVKDPSISNGQVLHATYSKKSPYNTCTPEGVDECASWGDYFYMEALTRLSTDWESYW
jgi:unsaturated chondroitin disaccharide hydrolase